MFPSFKLKITKISIILKYVILFYYSFIKNCKLELCLVYHLHCTLFTYDKGLFEIFENSKIQMCFLNFQIAHIFWFDCLLKVTCNFLLPIFFWTINNFILRKSKSFTKYTLSNTIVGQFQNSNQKLKLY